MASSKTQSPPLIFSAGAPPPNPKPPPSLHHRQSSPHLLAAGSIFLPVFLFLTLICRKLSRKRTAPADAKPPHRYSYSVLRRATSSFSVTNRIGRGGSGTVYRGKLPSEKDVAVKVMDSGSLQGEVEFQNELLVAGNVDSDRIVSVIGFSSDKKRRRMVLVYDLMHNGSLQEAMLNRKCPELMDWKKRFSVAIDIAKGIEYLHIHCNPPIFHGDIKASNILLDREFTAKIADFGLARLKSNDQCEITVENKGELETKKEELTIEVDNGSVIEEVAITLDVNQSPESTVRVSVPDISPERSVRVPVVDLSPETIASEGSPKTAPSALESPRNWDMSSASELNLDNISVRSGGSNMKKSGSKKDWWWPQDNGENENGEVKNYVKEWIGNEISQEKPKSHWFGASSSSGRKKENANWWKEKRRPPKEWWKEEYCEELAKKKRKKKKKRGQGFMSEGDNWWPRDEDSSVGRKKKSRGSGSSRGSIDWWLDGLSGELWRGHHNSHDSALSGEIPGSGGITSTPSMRGTVCYVAPEYGGGGELSEKCDVYSFGVLLLVIVSGRRPLQVSTSPVTEIKRASLLSWARHLGRAGKLIDLVDKSIESLDKEQALLCITVALRCLQKLPTRRPNMKEVVGMLTGEIEPPRLPFEFSPSSPSQFPFKTQKKVR